MEGEEEVDVETGEDSTAPPRLPAMGAAGHGALPPPYTSVFEIHHNVWRIAGQVSEGKDPTYD